MFDKFARYVGVQGVLALALTGAVIALALAGRAVPDVLANLTSAAAGFYFGSKGATITQAVLSDWFGVCAILRERSIVFHPIPRYGVHKTSVLVSERLAWLWWAWRIHRKAVTK